MQTELHSLIEARRRHLPGVAEAEARADFAEQVALAILAGRPIPLDPPPGFLDLEVAHLLLHRCGPEHFVSPSQRDRMAAWASEAARSPETRMLMEIIL